MSDTRLQSIVFQPGIFKDSTEYAAEGRWVDGDKIRFRNGRPEKIGGWVGAVVSQSTDTTVTSFTGVSRKLHSWRDLAGDQYLASGSHKKLELMTDGLIYDITPVRENQTINNAITTVSGNSIVTITDTAPHGLSIGDFVYVNSQASAVDGITLSGQYEVLTVTSSTDFTIDSGTNATGSTSGGGGDLDIDYLLENGYADNGDLTGYSGGTWGTPGSATQTTVNLNNAITTNGSTTISIEDTSHGLSVGDEVVVVSQASAVDGIDLSGNDFTGDFEVASVTDANNYTIIARNSVTLETVTATGSTSGGGGDLVLIYGAEGWGKPRAGTGGAFLRLWSLDTWGEDLVACVKDGKIYHWDATNGVNTRAQALSNAPSRNTLILVSQPSRHLVAFGSEVYATSTFDPLIIRWAEQETLNNWAITATNSAGEYRLPKGNKIVAAVQTRSEIVVFTDSEVYSMRYVGGNDVFQFEPLGTNVSTISQNAVIDVNGVLFWEGVDDFYMYDGVIKVLPSTIDKFVFDQDGEGRLNSGQLDKVTAGINKEFNEILWFYPDYTSTENNRYVQYNYVENVFSYGTLERTAWVDRGTFTKPYGIAANGTLYVHESGKDADGAPLVAYIRSSYFDLEDGEDIVFVDRILPDIKLAQNRNIEITVFTKKYPHPRAKIITKGPYYFDDTLNQIKMRARGRQLSIEYRVTSTGADFEVGKVRIGLQKDGER